MSGRMVTLFSTILPVSMNLKKPFQHIVNTIKAKPSNLVHFFGIWTIASIGLYDFLPKNTNVVHSLWFFILIGFSVALCVALIYLRRKAMDDIKAAPDFDQLTPEQKGHRLFKKLKAPGQVINSFVINFIIFSLIGLSSSDIESSSDIWFSLLFGAVVALVFAITKTIILGKWRNDDE